MRKQFFLWIIMFLFTTTVKSQSNTEKIDFDYQKLFFVKYVAIDKNQNGSFEDNETFEFDEKLTNAYVEFKDFGTAGNRISVQLELSDGKEKTKFIGFAEDVNFKRVIKDGYTYYVVLDKLQDDLFTIYTNSDKENTFVVWNYAILKRINK